MVDAIHNWLYRLGGLSAVALVSQWMKTLDYAVTYYDERLDPAHDEFRGPVIYVFWHEYIPFLFYTRSFCNIAMLVSQHRDAELLSQAARFYGFETVRGSTQRGGGTALRDLHRKGQYMNLAITPDGPRGPRRRCAPGAVYLSSKMQIPIVAVGLGYNRPYRMQTWDRFALPPMWGRGRAILGPALQMPAELDRDGVEHYRQEVEHQLNTLTTLAEDWADSGGTLVGQQIGGRKFAKKRRVGVSQEEASNTEVRLHRAA
jgi:lysophospholipid acyltransferase (LPLAT)-like uncharacterized protein